MNKLKGLINKIFEDLTGKQIVNALTTSATIAKLHFGNKEVIITEVGVYEGMNARRLLRNLNIKELYLVDAWEKYDEYLEMNKPQTVLSRAYKRCKRKVNKYKNKVSFIIGYSSKVLDKIPQSDYIYIDANHSYKYVLEDLENYYPKVKEGGIFAGHDIQYSEVLKAVKDFTNKYNLKFNQGIDDWWIIKDTSKTNLTNNSQQNNRKAVDLEQHPSSIKGIMADGSTESGVNLQHREEESADTNNSQTAQDTLNTEDRK